MKHYTETVGSLVALLLSADSDYLPLGMLAVDCLFEEPPVELTQLLDDALQRIILEHHCIPAQVADKIHLMHSHVSDLNIRGSAAKEVQQRFIRYFDHLETLLSDNSITGVHLPVMVEPEMVVPAED